MPTANKPHLVISTPTGFGRAIELSNKERFTLGRSNECDIVIKDNSCSRLHAEVFLKDDRWFVRDLDSKNGVKVNGKPVSERCLSPRDQLRLGPRVSLLFVENLEQLPKEKDDELIVKDRLTEIPDPAMETLEDYKPGEDYSYVFNSALKMLSAGGSKNLIQVALECLLKGTGADVAAILKPQPQDAPVLLDKKSRPDLLDKESRPDRVPQPYIEAPRDFLNDAIHFLAAIRAENSGRVRHLRNPKNLPSSYVASVICAPAVFEQEVVGLIHLYCTDPHNTLNDDDLKITLLLAKILGPCMYLINRQEIPGRTSTIQSLKMPPLMSRTSQDGNKEDSNFEGVHSLAKGARLRNLEAARVLLRQIVATLEEYRWKKGEASVNLFGHRFKLTKRVNAILERYPTLRAEEEFKRVAEEFPPL